MSEEPKAGFTVTSSKIALALSVITILGVGFQGSRFLLDTNYRISSLEEKWIDAESAKRDFATEIRNLSVSLNELNLILREVQVRQQNGN